MGKTACALLMSAFLMFQPPGTAWADEPAQDDAQEVVAQTEDGEQTAEDSEALTAQETTDYTAHLTFSDSAITETSSGAGYAISGTTLTISAAGTYLLSGSCSEGAVIVAASDVTIELDGLTLASSSTAPIVVKKTCTGVCIHLMDETTSTITNSENPANETSTDTEVADAFEGACIKAKTDSSVTFCGGGNLTCVANTKNGIKGGTNATLTFNTTGTVTVSGSYSGYATSAGAVNNGIASDGSLTFNAGTYVVAAANDGIKAVPDSDDTTSAGDVTINGGTFDIDVDGDAIQAEHNLTINAGTFDIKTMSGYNSSGYDEDTMSCKGLKASGDREDIENTITVNGGDFSINTVDDAVHSDMYVLVTSGTFDIYTGDDGMHADTTLTLGTSGGYERDPDVNIAYSYEGLEAGTVYIYSGRHYVYATDDGINAAGGSSSGTDQGQPGGDGFGPGGGGPGSHGGGPGSSGSSTSSDYNLYIYGGEVYVNCLGDGLDSNGGLYLYGGKTAVFSQASGGDNSPCDTDGEWVINGGTLFCAGTNSMRETPSNSQYYYTDTSSRSANTKLTVSYNNAAMYSCTLPRTINYLLYSDPSMTSSSCSISTGSLAACNSCAWRSSWEHSWGDESSSDGVTTYTCSSCGATERQTEASEASVSSCDHSVEATTVTEYTATFQVVDGDGATSSNATINTYHTQDYDTASETNVTTAIARDSTTGEADVSGSGQINFTVVPAEGYNVDGVSVSGSYKNLKGPDETGVANTYRITKVAGDLTVTVTVSACAHANVGNPTWTWSDDYTTATASFVCSDCGNTVTVDGTVTSELTDASTITFTATAEIGGNTYTDTKTAAPFTGTFSIVDTDGNASTNATINSYYTQDYTTASETGVTTAVARDGDTGNPLLSGGQINFAVVPADGYTVQSVTATDGTYKNIKGPSDTGKDNTYRITKVTNDLTVTVTMVPTYTVTWANSDGTVLETDKNVAYGTTPTYNGSTPTKSSTARYTYTFKGWTPTVAAVTGNVVYYAQYTVTTNTYTITWKNADGTVLETDKNVAYGTTPTYDGSTPTKAATAQYTYSFKGWSPSISVVTGNKTYTATYNTTTNTCSVSFVANGGSGSMSKQYATYGSAVTLSANGFTRSGYSFSGWNTAADGSGTSYANRASVRLTGSIKLYAQWTADGQDMYRLYNPNSGEHFYTANASERSTLVAAGWTYEGVGWTAPTTSSTPVYRLYSGTDHHYTTSASERDYLITVGWTYEGIGWYSDDAQATPLYRQFNPNVDPSASRNNSGSHNYTTSKSENDFLVSIGWVEEGIGWYGL